MESLTVDTTYGEALFQAADELNKIDVFNKELKTLGDVFDDNPEFFEMLKSPVFSNEEKKDVVDKVFHKELSEELINFLKIITDKRRLINYKGIVREYFRLVDEKDGFTSGEVFSAVEISKKKLEELEKETGALLKKRVKLKNTIDESLIGGVKIYVDGKLIDASIRRSLDDLKEKLISHRI